MLIDNNGYIVVGEELPHIGRPLTDYDERLMQALVDLKLFHQVTLTDYQAICARNPELEQQLLLQQQQQQNRLHSQAPSSSATKFHSSPSVRFSSVATNLAAIGSTVWSVLGALLGQQLVALGWLLLGASSELEQAQAQSAIVNQSLLALLPNKTYLRPCERQVTLYETRPYSAALNAGAPSGIDAPEYYVSKCGCSAWFVYEQVPKTNLVMLIVNTTLACRRCDQQLQQPASNLIPVPIDASFAVAEQQKVQEEQVCSMLEREAQLQAQTRRTTQDTCYDSHPDESQIHICGAGSKAAPISHKLTVVSLLFALATHSALRRPIHLSGS